MPRGMAAIFYLDVCSHVSRCSGLRTAAPHATRGQRLQFTFRKMAEEYGVTAI